MNIPTESKKLRACLLCSQIKSIVQFKKDGCENCEEILQMRGSTDRVYECTSPNYTGMIALTRPDESWVGRWQRIDKFQKGMYAIQVLGRLPENAVDELESRGIRYYPRDGTKIEF